MYEKSKHYINFSGFMSTRSYHRGLFSTFDHKSHTAFTIPPTAICITPFSGPIHLIWGSQVSLCQNLEKSSIISSKERPRNRSWSSSTHFIIVSVPFPIVNIMLVPVGDFMDGFCLF
jgi:hypothetical protein